MREIRTQITVLKDIKVMVFKDKYSKNFIHICPQNLKKRSLDIRWPFNPHMGNYVLIMNLTIRNSNTPLMDSSRSTPLIILPYLNLQMNLIIGNLRGANGPDFRPNFRSLVDWHKPPLVALLQTKMQDHLVLLNDFSFNKIIEVSAIGNAGGSLQCGMILCWSSMILQLPNRKYIPLLR